MNVILDNTPLLGAVIVIPRDPAVYIFALLAFICIYCLIWLFARHEVDLEAWRVIAIGAGSIIPLIFGYLLIKQNGWLGFGMACVFAVAIGGWAYRVLFELEGWKRWVLALLTPVVAGVLFPVSVILRNLILNYFANGGSG